MLCKSDGKNMYFSSVLEKIGYIGLTQISYCAKYEAMNERANKISNRRL